MTDTHWHISIQFVTKFGNKTKEVSNIDTRHSTRNAAKQYKKRNFKHKHPDFVQYIIKECENKDTCTIGIK